MNREGKPAFLLGTDGRMRRAAEFRRKGGSITPARALIGLAARGEGADDAQGMASAIAAGLFSLAAAAGAADNPLPCSDRNTLNGVSVDARLVAIRYYYHGLVQGATDPNRKAYYQFQLLKDDGLAAANKALELIERNCLPGRRRPERPLGLNARETLLLTRYGAHPS
jgi:hypothetical protein